MEHLSDVVRHCLAALLGGWAMLRLFAPGLIRKLYRRPGSSNSRIRATALVPGLSAGFLAIPHTLVWGILLGGLTLFVAVVAMLKHGRYALAVLGMLLMAAMPVTFLSVWAVR